MFKFVFFELKFLASNLLGEANKQELMKLFLDYLKKLIKQRISVQSFVNRTKHGKVI